MFHETPMITEKTIKAIINHHPFIIWGHANNTNLLESVGFRTFNEKLLKMPPDPSDDNVTFFQRLHNLIQSLIHIQHLSNSDLEKMWSSLEEDTIHNYKTLINTDWVRLHHDKLMQCAEFLPITITKNDNSLS
jgi:hypothetical protein